MKRHKTISFLLGFFTVLCLGWTYTLQTDRPLGSDAPSVIDDYFRNDKAGWQERLNVDHYFPLTASSMSDSDTGYHRQIHFYSTTGTDPILDFVTTGGRDELQYTDSSGSAIQLTDSGGFNMDLLTSQTITTPTLTSPTINTGVSGTAILDDDSFGTATSTTLATSESIKAYVDNGGGFSPTTYAGGESVTFPNGLIMKMGYVARTSASTTVTFGTQFPSSVLSVQITAKNASVSADYNHIISSLSVTSFTIITAYQYVDGYYWLAVGY